MTTDILTLDLVIDDTITGDLDAYSVPVDMRREIETVLTDENLPWSLYRASLVDFADPVWFLVCPESGRGGVCCGGNTDWMDCDGIDDLIARWQSEE